jgi:RNA polymerase sigma factor (sigma-70 family)
MTAANANPLLRHLHRLAAGPAAVLPDRDLLQRFLERRDEAAFAALVERHGPLVFAVCRAVLGHAHDAEDAFQATFLVLARGARAIRRRDSLGSWLHGVAYRVARKARAAAARRQALEAKAVPPAPGVSADALSWGEVRAALHAELAALPERFREPLVLCYLEGLTQDEAARRLGWTAATVKGRLQRGRERLRRRLVRRGLGLAALGAAALTGEASAAPVPAALATAAVRAALPAADEAAPAAAVVLARGVTGPLGTAKLRATAALLLLTAVLAGGAALCLRRPADDGPAPAAPPPPDARPPAARVDPFGDALPDGAVARLGTVRVNHGYGLNALAFAPDGKTVLSEGEGWVRLWGADTGKEVRQAATAKASFDDQLILTPDGTALVSLNQDGFDHDTLRVWDLAQMKETRAVPLPVRRREISIYRRNAVSPDGRLGAVHTPEQVQVFDLETARELYRLPKGRDEVAAVTFAGNDLLVTADKKQLVEVWEARTGKPVRQFAHGSPVAVLAASADGRRLATLEHHTDAIDRLLDRDVVHVWDLTTGKQAHTLAARPQSWYMNVRFAPDGKRLFAASFGSDGDEVTVWDTESGERVRTLDGAVGRVLAVSPDGTRLAEGGLTGKFTLWDLTTGRRLGEDDSRHARAAALFLSPAGDRVFTTSYWSISTWDGTTGRRLRSFDLPSFPQTDPDRAYSPDGRYALSFAGDLQRLEVLVWDVAAGRRLHTLAPPGPSHVTTAFAPDSSRFATWHSGKEPVVRLWDVATGREVGSFPETKAGWPGRLAFAPDGKTLMVAGRRTVGYDVATGRELFSWRMKPLPSQGGKFAVGGVTPSEDDRVAWRTLAVSPDGTLAACVLSGGDFNRERLPNRVLLCDARTGQVLRRCDDSGIPSRGFEELAFSADSRLLASSDGDAVHVWEAATAGAVCTFRGHRGEVRALAFSGDGRRLASGGEDSTVLVWDVTLPSPPAGDVGEKEVAAWWADLAGADAGRAYAAVWRLAEVPGESVPFLHRRLHPVTEADEKQVRQDIADLDSDTFAVRQKALRELEGLGVAAAPALREARARDVSPEVRRRLEQLLEGASSGPLSGEPLRAVRALAVLEHAGTPEARRLVRELADGAPGAWLTQEARAAQARTVRPPVDDR